MYKRIDFTKLEGIATYQDTLDFLQTSYRDAISAIAKAFGGRVIVTGVTDQGTTFSDGWVIIDGELMPFTGGLKTDRVIIDEATDTEVFGDGSVQTVYYTHRAKLGVTGGFAFSDFIRVDTMSAISQGLKSLVIAHNNLQNAFNTHTHSWYQITDKPGTFPPSAHRHNWSEIDNKPALLTPLTSGSIYVGDVADDREITVFFPNVGTSNYVVVGNLVSLTTSNWNNDNDIFWMVGNKNPSYFWLLMREVSRDIQNVRFDYVLIPF
jgi:hypothetical protein